MVVEVELPAAPYGPGYKRPYASSPLSVAAGSAGTARAPPIPSPSTSAFAAYNPYRPLNPSASLSNNTRPPKGASPMPPAPSYTSPYYHPSPAAKVPSPNISASPSAPTIVTQAKNYVILDTPDATPADDYAYLFGDHVNWGTLKVLPKNHPCGVLQSRSILFVSFWACARLAQHLTPPDILWRAGFHLISYIRLAPKIIISLRSLLFNRCYHSP